jgi:prevent-host-death family protein
MIASQIISISDLRTHWSKVLEWLKQSHKYIVVNNKPKAVLLSCEEYEQLINDDEKNNWVVFTDKNRQAYREAKKDLESGDVLSLDQLKKKHGKVYHPF